MDFKNKQSPKISDSKAYGQWESIMKNSGWFENEQLSGEYEMDKVSNLEGASVIEKIKNSDNSNLRELTCKSKSYFEINTEQRSFTQCR